MKCLAFMLLVLWTLDVSGQSIRPEVMIIVQRMEKSNWLFSEHVGYAGTTPTQYRTFEKLRDNATVEELVELLQHKSSAVKGYASWALADRKYADLASILAEFLRTGETTTTMHGCIVSEGDLATELYDRVYYQHIDRKLSSEDNMFFRSQIHRLDSVVLYSAHDTQLLNRALENNNGDLARYDRIKRIAHDRKSSLALVALAEYRRRDDIPFIIEQEKKSFRAVSVFPDRSFWSLLTGYRLTERSLEYYLAVASYKDANALQLLEDMCNDSDLHVNELDEALIKNYCPLYQDLILRLWAEHKTIDITVTRRLIADCPERSAKAFAIGLMTRKPFNPLRFDDNYEPVEYILPLIIRTVSEYENDQIIAICNSNIVDAQWLELQSFLEYIKDKRITQTTSSMLQGLEGAHQALEIFHLSETLISFGDSGTNTKVAMILKSKQREWDWGEWSKEFRKLLRTHHISVH